MTTALIGASRWEQIADLLAALDNAAFTDEELTAINRYALDGGINIWWERSPYPSGFAAAVLSPRRGDYVRTTRGGWLGLGRS